MMKVALLTVCAAGALTLAGCAQTDRNMLVAGADGHPAAYTDKKGKPLYRWEQELRDNPAAASLIREQLYGIPPDAHYENFYQYYDPWNEL